MFQRKRGLDNSSFTNHDFRSMFKDFDDVYRMLNDASKKYDLKFKFCGAREKLLIMNLGNLKKDLNLISN